MLLCVVWNTIEKGTTQFSLTMKTEHMAYHRHILIKPVPQLITVPSKTSLTVLWDYLSKLGEELSSIERFYHFIGCDWELSILPIKSREAQDINLRGGTKTDLPCKGVHMVWQRVALETNQFLLLSMLPTVSSSISNTFKY